MCNTVFGGSAVRCSEIGDYLCRILDQDVWINHSATCCVVVLHLLVLHQVNLKTMLSLESEISQHFLLLKRCLLSTEK